MAPTRSLKSQVDSLFWVHPQEMQPWPRRDIRPLPAMPNGRLEGSTGGATLGIHRLNQGVGLDFVRNREYGRLRWLKYPAETQEDRL
jgi:hypothetical protein